MKEIKKDRIYLGIIAASLLLCLVFLGYRMANKPEAKAPKTGAGVTAETGEESFLNKKIFTTETTIDSEVIEDGLTKMGFLITAKYFFKDVTTSTKVSSLGKLDLGFTRANLVFSYEGYVPAGIDFTKIKVDADNAKKTILVTVPHAEIMDVFIDPESFEKLDEKENIFNKFHVEDYNNSVKELEGTCREKAEERGLLKEADTNAEALIRNFAASFTEEAGYQVRVEFE